MKNLYELTGNVCDINTLLINKAELDDKMKQCRDSALRVIRSVKQEAETALVIGDELGMRDGLTQILKELDAALGITT